MYGKEVGSERRHPETWLRASLRLGTDLRILEDWCRSDEAASRLTRKEALVSQCCRIRPAGLEPATLGLEIPCSIHLSYGREGGFCVSGGPLLGDL